MKTGEPGLAVSSNSLFNCQKASVTTEWYAAVIARETNPASTAEIICKAEESAYFTPLHHCTVPLGSDRWQALHTHQKTAFSLDTSQAFPPIYRLF